MKVHCANKSARWRAKPGTGNLNAPAHDTASQGVALSQGSAADPVERALELWCAYMHSWRAQERLGYPSRSAALATGGAESADTFDELCAEADLYVGQAMEAIIDSLPPIERAALSHVYLHTAWCFRDLDAVLTRAKASVRRKMPSRGLPV